MAAIDGISLLIVAFSTLHGVWRGFTRLALGLCLWTVAFMAAMRFHTPMAVSFTHPTTPTTPPGSNLCVVAC